ncbi:UDP-N-acetylmuramoyl-tripeptide--D-alanyl-D-alanine ligase [Sphingomonas sp.]|uniref:UDP-N-acetylmuramoyl-tripeptide--D-alanyl-D- alanine ligase n=1 Tax=Sphingomonas sp. TaxID=28214 RepID=UPI002DBDD5E5|nr:UDP-N-acetylmuramoyl-tripeptide--D-alanyl-D-alanine ligase [Sphingomonas sp.]HEU4969273.1 UDP-N-acetylmuramoyl-tripeptide--D-alanyl-D-alanine ligase [Sphingomonas sp.]
MTALWTSFEIAAAVSGVASADFVASGVAFDSREVGAGDLFIALAGETTDGHRFVDQAFTQGAAGAIVARPVPYPHILVADTRSALDALGIAGRARTAAKIVGVTGSVGKTGTKEALFAAFDRIAPGYAHRSLKSYNNHTGVPLSLARMPEATRFGVFEMGMNHAGEISALTRLVRPHIAVVTTIAPAHIEMLGSIEAIARAKAEIFEGLEPGGTAVIPHDSPQRAILVEAAKAHGARVLTFGLGEGADVRALERVTVKGGGTLVTVQLPEASLTMTIGQPGEHWVSNALAVIAAVEAAEADLAIAGLAIAELQGIAGRGARVQVQVPGGEALVIDESYNANPASMRATLKVLGDEEAPRRIAVLGAMRELGEQGPRFHAELAEPIRAANVDFALLVGDEMAPLAKELEGRCEFAHVPAAAAALDALKGHVGAGDAVLIKASNSVGLGRLVAELSAGALAEAD